MPPTIHRDDSVAYRLIDFGDGRKLEQIGPYRLDRPSPAALPFRKSSPDEWSQSTSRYDEIARQWHHRQPWSEPVLVGTDSFVMPVQPTPFGHLGLFPEQRPNWRWLQSVAAPAVGALGLNLFAYTGASTMAMVAAGMDVAHVDAAKPNVAAARSAAEINGWGDRAIRYLVDDASAFVRRELRRGRRYHTIVLDPPAYGHGPKGKSAKTSAWRIERNLWPLLRDCVKLLKPDSHRLIVTGHSPDIDQRNVTDFLSEFGNDRHVQQGRLTIPDAHERPLDAGFFVRWWRE